MNIAYSLGNQVSLEKIVKDINKLCRKIPPQELSESVLVISIQKIGNHIGDSPLPKIAYDPNCFS